MSKENVQMIEAYEKNQDTLFAKANVVGFGLGHKIKDGVDTGKECITVMVTQKLEEDILRKDDIISSSDVEGMDIDIIETGEIFAGNQLNLIKDCEVQEEVGVQTLKQRIRPAMGGFSVGHYKITAGTIGTCVYDLNTVPGIPSKYYILSNNHVLANSNEAKIGDPILQPGPYDGGSYPNDLIASLSRFVPIKFKTSTSAPNNYVDAAIAEGEFHDLNREIYWIGYVKQVKSNPKVGDLVEKTGRTTNFTTGSILSLNSVVDVNYGGGRVARFANQIVTTVMSAGGDSGSLVCDISEGAVGLLFAGSSKVTIINNILYVQKLLGIRLHP